jgi:hypothetical protein
MSDLEKQVEALVEKAVKAEKSDDAMRLSQAALNAAHVAQVLDAIKRDKK